MALTFAAKVNWFCRRIKWAAEQKPELALNLLFGWATVVGLSFAFEFSMRSQIYLTTVTAFLLAVLGAWTLIGLTKPLPAKSDDRLRLRKAMPADAGAIYKILRECFKEDDTAITPMETFKGWLKSGVLYCIIQHMDKYNTVTPVGFYSIHIMRSSAFGKLRKNKFAS